ncbi:MAG: di-trans,poly-cis-decaprenylcistransferase [Acidobacteria bacterium]|nr:MAG: di-trans,poly-cis-decaprenylcistransferase [Acidobacteriota bacterium]
MRVKKDSVTSSGGATASVAVAPPARTLGKGLPWKLAWQGLKNLIKWPFYTLYLHHLRAESHGWQLPRHIGFIMDGNRRFARVSGFANPLQGHHKGAEKLQEVLDWCYQTGIKVVTVWCFSLDNFQRSTAEVEGLLRLFEDKTREMASGDAVHENRVRVRFIGKLELLPESLREEIRRVEEATADYDAYQLNIAMAYGGREEITDAFRRHIAERAAQGASIDEIVSSLEAADVDPYLYTSGQPEPDLILRTSGELRSSGFLLWQSAYSELYFADACWPAFREIDFLRALRSFDQRQRRYGR